MGAPCLSFLASLVAIAMPPATHDPPEKPQKVDVPDARDPKRPRKVALFRAEGFPTIDAPAIDDEVLGRAFEGLPAETLATPDAVKERLRIKEFDVFVLPYGSAFPISAWQEIKGFLERGGGLVVLGGAPFHQPVRWEAGPAVTEKRGGKWILGPRQPTFARELLIGPAEEIAVGDGELRAVAESEWTLQNFPKPARTFALTV